jgi:type IV pilus assembly protein PilB
MKEIDIIPSTKKRLGEILLDLGFITEEQLAHALQIQSSEKRLLGQVLIKLGYVTPETIISALDMQDVSIFDSPDNK